MCKSTFRAARSSLGRNPADQAQAAIDFYRRSHDITAKSFRQDRDSDLGNVVGRAGTAERDLRYQLAEVAGDETAARDGARCYRVDPDAVGRQHACKLLH